MKMPHIKNCLVVPSLFQYLVVINSVSFSCKRLGFFSTKWGWGEIHVDLKKHCGYQAPQKFAIAGWMMLLSL
jgi:hypothetical protein